MTTATLSPSCGTLLRHYREHAAPTAGELRVRRNTLAAQVAGLTPPEMAMRIGRRRGLTQEELVARCGLSVEGLRKIERDRVCPLDDTILLLARALGVTNAERDALLSAAQTTRAVRAAGSARSRPRALHSTSPREMPPLGGSERLPESLTSFVGRQEALARLTALLQPHHEPASSNAGAGSCRLLTLTGPGGTGKSRLALAAAALLAPTYAAGVRLVELAALPLTNTEVSPFEQAVGLALGSPFPSPRVSLAALIEALQGREVLLLLDNLEHLVAVCRSPVAALLRACPELRILATSREALGIAGEWVWPVPPLTLPPCEGTTAVAGAWAQSEAVTLFVERARSRVPNFTLDAYTGAAVAGICRRLDGLPLAIELAAARLPALSLADLTARLDDRFALLARGNAAAPPRQQTLRATMDWSYRLLSPRAATLLRRLAPFSGSWTHSATSHICVDAGLPASTTLDALTELVEHSLIQVEQSSLVGSGSARYSMLETVWEYARTLLLEEEGATRLHAVQHRHLDWYLRVAECRDGGSQDMPLNDSATPAGAYLEGARRHQHEGSGALGKDTGLGAWSQALEREEGNLRAALGYAVAEPACSEQGLRLAAALWPFWLGRSAFREGRRWLIRTLEASETAAWQQTAPELRSAREGLYRTRIEALYGVGQLAAQQGAQSQARAFFEECAALRRALR